MINDFFTQEFLEKLRQGFKLFGPWIAALLLILFVISIVGRFQEELAALDRISEEDSSLTLREAFVKITPTLVPTPDPNVVKVASTPTPEPVPVAPAPDEVVSAMTKTGCGGCHIIPGVPGAVGQVGPDLTMLGAIAGQRRPGYNAESYIHESIVEPEAFIAPECPAGSCPTGIMVAALSASLSEAEVTAMVDYLSTLAGDEITE